MKTKVIVLQGQDFVLSSAAEPLMLEYLKRLQRATRFHPTSYRQNVEALRDVLLSEKPRIISKPRLASAITLVGVPETSFLEGLSPRLHWLPRLLHVSRDKARRLKNIQGRTIMLRGSAVIAIALAVTSGIGAFSSFNIGGHAQGWTIVQTTLGPVRAWSEAPSELDQGGWPLNWSAGAMYCVVFTLLAVSLYMLSRRKSLSAAAGVVICLVSLTGLWSIQQSALSIPPQSRIMPGGSTQPLQPRLAYVQQCGDEIPYVFDGQTSGMLFRQLRDQGFILAAPITTHVSEGTIDTVQLCSVYDGLRRTYPKADIILQNYTQQAVGTLRPYDFADLQDGTVTFSYGLFVKTAK